MLRKLVECYSTLLHLKAHHVTEHQPVIPLNSALTSVFYKWLDANSYVRKVSSLRVWVETFISREDTMRKKLAILI
jgi:hypothetical protein